MQLFIIRKFEDYVRILEMSGMVHMKGLINKLWKNIYDHRRMKIHRLIRDQMNWKNLKKRIKAGFRTVDGRIIIIKVSIRSRKKAKMKNSKTRMIKMMKIMKKIYSISMKIYSRNCRKFAINK